MAAPMRAMRWTSTGGRNFWPIAAMPCCSPIFAAHPAMATPLPEAGSRQWGLKMQDDITDGVKKAIADGIADPKRVCIVGASYGGYAALAGAAFTPDLYACAVAVAGVSDLPRLLRMVAETFGTASQVQDFEVARIGSLDDDRKQLDATSPALHADQIKSPVLLIHGEGDTTVPIAQSEAMERALKDAKKPVTFVRMAKIDHYLSTSDGPHHGADGNGELPGQIYRPLNHGVRHPAGRSERRCCARTAAPAPGRNAGGYAARACACPRSVRPSGAQCHGVDGVGRRRHCRHRRVEGAGRWQRRDQVDAHRACFPAPWRRGGPARSHHRQRRAHAAGAHCIWKPDAGPPSNRPWRSIANAALCKATPSPVMRPTHSASFFIWRCSLPAICVRIRRKLEALSRDQRHCQKADRNDEGDKRKQAAVSHRAPETVGTFVPRYIRQRPELRHRIRRRIHHHLAEQTSLKAGNISRADRVARHHREIDRGSQCEQTPYPIFCEYRLYHVQPSPILLQDRLIKYGPWPRGQPIST